MSTNQVVFDLEEKATNSIRALLGFGGLLATVVGLVILIWPSKTAMAVAAIVGVWALIAALVSIAIGVFARSQNTWPRIGNVILGVLLAGGAIYIFLNLGAAATGLASLLGIIVGVSWILQGITSLTLLGGAKSRIWALLYAAISILAGVVLLLTPLLAATMLFLLIGVSFVVLGLTQLVRAFRFGSL